MVLFKLPIETIILAKDKAIISYKKLNIIRKTLILKNYIPSTDTIVKNLKIINNKIKDRYNIKVKKDCIILKNIEQFINDYVTVIKKKESEKNIFLLKWSCDQRLLLNNCGNVGISIQLLEKEGNQDPHRVMYTCIGNGKENRAFFENHLKSHRKFCSKFVNDEYSIEEITIKNFFLADLKHLWENSYEFSNPAFDNQPFVPWNYSI